MISPIRMLLSQATRHPARQTAGRPMGRNRDRVDADDLALWTLTTPLVRYDAEGWDIYG
jgi:hypothetical protein